MCQWAWEKTHRYDPTQPHIICYLSKLQLLLAALKYVLPYMYIYILLFTTLYQTCRFAGCQRFPLCATDICLFSVSMETF